MENILDDFEIEITNLKNDIKHFNFMVLLGFCWISMLFLISILTLIFNKDFNSGVIIIVYWFFMIFKIFLETYSNGTID